MNRPIRKPWRRFLQWRLATLLGVVTLAAGLLGTWRYLAEPYRVQWEAERALDVFGAEFDYEPGRPAWLSPFVDDEQFHRVVAYRVENQPLRDHHLERLPDLPHLERVYLGGTDVGDEVARLLGQLPRLRRLALWHTRLTDVGLREISNCATLEALDLHATCVTDDGLEGLLPLVNLRELTLGGPIHGPGLRHVAELPNLEILYLNKSCVSYADLKWLAGSPVKLLDVRGGMPASLVAHLCDLPQLQVFDAYMLGADDETVSTLIGACRNLEQIHAVGIGITDASIDQLARLPELKQLLIRGNLTDKSLAALSQENNLIYIELTGRFSMEAIYELAAAQPGLFGQIATVVPPDQLDRSKTGNLFVSSLIQLEADYDNRLTDNGVEYATAVVNWPATVRDVIQFESDSTQITGVHLDRPATYDPWAHYDRRYQSQALWTLDGIEELAELKYLVMHRVAARGLPSVPR